MPERIETITNPAQLPRPFTDMLCAPSLQTLLLVARRRSVDVRTVWHLKNATNEMWYAESR